VSATDGFLSGPKVDARYGISPMTRWRWQRSLTLNFPKPIDINGRKFWKVAKLEAWERSRTPPPASAER
jgi:predicted DNA-binding transcriptional regulator AlpA